MHSWYNNTIYCSHVSINTANRRGVIVFFNGPFFDITLDKLNFVSSYIYAYIFQAYELLFHEHRGCRRFRNLCLIVSRYPSPHRTFGKRLPVDFFIGWKTVRSITMCIIAAFARKKKKVIEDLLPIGNAFESKLPLGIWRWNERKSICSLIRINSTLPLYPNRTNKKKYIIFCI